LKTACGWQAKGVRDSVDKIVISPGELAEIPQEPGQAPRLEPKLPPAIAWWARLGPILLVPVLPLLCLVTIILRVALRSQPPRTRHAWTAYLSTLLVISGILTSLAGVAVFSLGPLPSVVGSGLAELDERTEYPELPARGTMSGADASRQLKRLVAVISPGGQSLFGKREILSSSFGAGMLLHADSTGYLFATARHVIGTSDWNVAKKPRALISLASGVWSGADVIARHANLDLALIWLPRHSGQGEFAQPVAEAKEGENIFVIGHPEGLKFTLSTGIISRLENNMLQISAPVSPGNSGGPVYDEQGNLVGVVSSTLDKSVQPNAENLNFAVAAKALVREAGWEFAQGGRERFQEYLHASGNIGKTSEHSASKVPVGFDTFPGSKLDGHN
jgi:S1-C subfamily serine protease